MRFYVDIVVDFVKRVVLTLVGEILHAFIPKMFPNFPRTSSARRTLFPSPQKTTTTKNKNNPQNKNNNKQTNKKTKEIKKKKKKKR